MNENAPRASSLILRSFVQLLLIKLIHMFIFIYIQNARVSHVCALTRRLKFVMILLLFSGIVTILVVTSVVEFYLFDMNDQLHDPSYRLFWTLM